MRLNIIFGVRERRSFGGEVAGSAVLKDRAGSRELPRELCPAGLALLCRTEGQSLSEALKSLRGGQVFTGGETSMER